MKEISEIDEAELRVQMKAMYKHVGLEGSMQCLYEIVRGGEILADVILEMRENEEKQSKQS